MSKTKKLIKYPFLVLLLAACLCTCYLWWYRVSLIQKQAIPRLEAIMGFSINGEVKEVSLFNGLLITNLSLGPVDKPVLRAKKASLDLPIFGLLGNKVFGRNSGQFVISEVTLDHAMLSARLTREGKIIFFPESKDPNRGVREKDADNSTQWKIENIKITESNIEVEDQRSNKQISTGDINLNLKDLGNGSSLTALGSFKLFIRNFGTEYFDPNLSYDEAFFTKVEISKTTAEFDQNMNFLESDFSAAMSSMFLFYKSKSLKQSNISMKGKIIRDTDWKLENFNIGGKDSTFFIKIPSSLNLSKPNFSKINFDLSLIDFDLANLKIIGADLRGILTLDAAGRVSKGFSQTKFSTVTKGLSGEFNKLKIDKPLDANIKFTLAIPENLDFFASGASLNDLIVDVTDADSKIIQASGKVSVGNKQISELREINLNIQELNFDKLRGLIKKQPDSGPKNKDINERDPSQNQEDDKTGSNQAQNLKISWPYSETKINLDFNNLLMGNYRLEALKVIGEVNPREIDLTKIELKNDKIILNSKFAVKLNDVQDYRLTVDADKIDVESLKIFYDKLNDRGLRGEIKNLRLEATGISADPTRLSKTLNAELNFNADDIYLPKELIDVPPFNLIFVPFTAVSAAFSVIPNDILPKELLNAGTGISNAVKDLQTFRLQQGSFDLRIADETIYLEEVRIGTSISGDLYFGGQIKFSKEIEINSGVTLLGVRVPLPITGTLESPRPDVSQFVKGLFTEFGLSIIRLPVTLFSRLGEMFYDKNDKTLEKTDSR